MQQEQATLETRRYDLSKVRIESPIDGIVTRRNIEEGEMVVIGTMNNAGTVLLTIADMSVIEAEVEVDETDIPTCSLGQRPRSRSTPSRTRRSPARSRRSATARSRRPAQRGAPGHELQSRRHARQAKSSRCVPDSRARPRSRRRPAKASCRCRFRRRRYARWSSTTRARSSASREARAAGAAARAVVQASELKPASRARSSRACSWCATERPMFAPVTTGIAGEKYFEVLSRPEGGRQRHHRTVQLGARTERRRRSQGRTAGAARRVAGADADEQVLRSGRNRAQRDLEPTSSGRS